MRDVANKTILQVIPALETGGAERTVLEVADAIIKAGGTALTTSQGGPMVAELEALGAQHIALPMASKNPLTMLRNTKRLTQLIQHHKVNIIHARSRAPAWSAYHAAQKNSIPFITTYHGVYRAKNSLKRYYNSVMARGDYVIANSEFTRGNVLAEHSPDPLRDESRLITIHRGADLSRFSADHVSPSRIETIYDHWGGQDAFRILLPGRLTEWKGQASFIEALTGLRETPKICAILCGSAQGRDEYQQTLQNLIDAQSDHDIRIVGHCDDMPAAFLWADVVISASQRPEAFGRVAIEAAAMGRPVIATDHGGAKETVVQGETGLLVPPGDTDALTAALVHIIALPAEKRAQMGYNACNRAREHFSIKAMTNATLEVYRSALVAQTG